MPGHARPRRAFSFSLSPALAVALAVALAGAGAAPAAGGSRRGSFDRAPFVHGRDARPAGAVAHAPAAFLAGDALSPTERTSPALAALLADVDTELARLVPGPRVAPAADVARGAPRVRFGCLSGDPGPDGNVASDGECDPRTRRMRFDVEGPSRAWREAAAAAAGDSVGALVVVQLSLGQHWVRQQDWKGAKAIELGRGRRVPVPWLTSLDDPVEVLQLTGALVARDGRVLRVAAEGLAARRTGMTASVLGAQEILTEEDLAAARAAARDDLPGAPPAWRAALEALVGALLEPR
uniref:Uncharacterized protein n=1 Tax=Eiseniibacteriota bacterium TaxID=2212470 RepID=A0A832I232_UNCEI